MSNAAGIRSGSPARSPRRASAYDCSVPGEIRQKLIENSAQKYVWASPAKSSQKPISATREDTSRNIDYHLKPFMRTDQKAKLQTRMEQTTVTSEKCIGYENSPSLLQYYQKYFNLVPPQPQH